MCVSSHRGSVPLCLAGRQAPGDWQPHADLGARTPSVWHLLTSHPILLLTLEGHPSWPATSTLILNILPGESCSCWRHLYTMGRACQLQSHCWKQHHCLLGASREQGAPSSVWGWGVGGGSSGKHWGMTEEVFSRRMTASFSAFKYLSGDNEEDTSEAECRANQTEDWVRRLCSPVGKGGWGSGQ